MFKKSNECPHLESEVGREGGRTHEEILRVDPADDPSGLHWSIGSAVSPHALLPSCSNSRSYAL